MTANTKIEWADHTFNPWWGCNKVSPACKGCYAEAWDKRTGGAHWGPNAPRRLMSQKHWREPLKWAREAAQAGVRARVFCASMADVFEDHPDIANNGLREQLWDLICQTQDDLIWMLLTKRPENIERFIAPQLLGMDCIWLGTTVEDRERANERLGRLLAIKSVVHFASMEPLLESVDLRRVGGDQFGWGRIDALSGLHYVRANATEGGAEWETEKINRLSWVIVGGESGPGARAMHPDWVRSLRDQCVDAGTAFHFKQWGEHAPNRYGAQVIETGQADTAWPDGTISAGKSADHGGLGTSIHRPGKKAAGRRLDGKEWNGLPTGLR